MATAAVYRYLTASLTDRFSSPRPSPTSDGLLVRRPRPEQLFDREGPLPVTPGPAGHRKRTVIAG